MVFTGAFFKRFDVAVRDLYVGKLTAIFRKFFKALFPMGDCLLFLLLLCRSVISFLLPGALQISQRLLHCAL